MCSISTVNISKCSFESVGFMNGDYNLNCDERRQHRLDTAPACVIMLRRDLRETKENTKEGETVFSTTLKFQIEQYMFQKV